MAWAVPVIAAATGGLQTYAQLDFERKGRHEAQGILQQQQAQARGDIESGYGQAEGEYDLIGGILQDQYAKSQARTIQAGDVSSQLAYQGYAQGIDATQRGYQSAIDAARSGYGSAMDQTRVGYGAARQQFQPWQASGEAANKAIADLNGLNGPEAQANAYSRIQYDPGYKARVEAANQALSRSALAQGNIFSGNFATALQSQNQNLASNEYANYYSRLMGVSGQGMNAAGNVAGLYSTEADRLGGYSAAQGRDIGNLYTGQGRDLSNLYTSQGMTLADIQARKYGSLAQQEESLGGQLSQYQANRAMLSANKGTALGNAALNYGNQQAGYSYSGGVNKANAYAQGIGNIGTAAAYGYGAYQNQRNAFDPNNPYAGQGSPQDRYTQYQYSGEMGQSME